jgi:uncharacterized membrane protein
MKREKHPAMFLVWLFLLGFLLLFVGFIFLALAILSLNGQAGFGGIIIVGPIPIIVGYGEDAPWLVLLAIVLTVVCLVTFTIFWKRK